MWVIKRKNIKKLRVERKLKEPSNKIYFRDRAKTKHFKNQYKRFQ